MNKPVDQAVMEQVFLGARTFNTFTEQQVSDELLMQLYDLMKWDKKPARIYVRRNGNRQSGAKLILIPT